MRAVFCKLNLSALYVLYSYATAIWYILLNMNIFHSLMGYQYWHVLDTQWSHLCIVIYRTAEALLNTTKLMYLHINPFRAKQQIKVDAIMEKFSSLYLVRVWSGVMASVIRFIKIQSHNIWSISKYENRNYSDIGTNTNSLYINDNGQHRTRVFWIVLYRNTGSTWAINCTQ